MGLYQSYRQVFVTNAPSLLAQGKTVDSLAVGQIGILDGKTNLSVNAPTYANNKAIKFVWGTPDVNLGDFGGVPNENEYTKLIKGKLIKAFRAKKAVHGKTPVYTVGWSGDAADTDTLFAKAGEAKSLFIKLSGTIIDRLYDKQGFVKQLLTVPACVDECGDLCASVSCPDLATQLVDQINSDKDLSKFIRAKSIVSCTGVTPPTEGTCYKFALSVCDTGDQGSLGIVQSKYPNEEISVIGRNGSTTTYGVTKLVNTAPAAFTGYVTVAPDCGTCPAGYTYTAAASGGVKESCTQTSPVSVAWTANGTAKNRTKTFTLTIADSVCGTNRLADLQAAYPTLTVALVVASGSCVHTYSTAVTSNCYSVGCAVDSITYPEIPMFEGAEWVAVPDAALPNGAACKCGIQIETSFFNRKTNECTFDAFPYENDIVYVQISNYNPDYNASPCETDWAVKQIRQVQYPQGHGAYVQHLEKESKQYDLHYRSYDPVVRDIMGYSLQADASKFYDQYTLVFETKFYTSGGWSEQYAETFSLDLFVPEATGTFLETAINGYLTSAGIGEDGAVV